jgi:hypothetical protein
MTKELRTFARSRSLRSPGGVAQYFGVPLAKAEAAWRGEPEGLRAVRDAGFIPLSRGGRMVIPFEQKPDRLARVRRIVAKT